MKKYIILLVIIFCSISIYSYAKGQETSTVVSSVYYLGQELGYPVDKEQLIQDLNYLGSSPLISEKLEDGAIIKAVRRQGIFLNGFNIEKGNLDKY